MGGGKGKGKGKGGKGGKGKGGRGPRPSREFIDNGPEPSTAQDMGPDDDEDNDVEDAEEGTVKKKKSKGGGFQSMDLSYPVYSGIMKMGYKVPTPIQRRAIPTILRGIDCVVMARTGSGKTAAFLVPMLQQLGTHSTKVGVRGMLLNPTRELAVQTFKFAKQIGAATGLRHCLLVGGDSMEEQFQSLSTNPDCIIGTPGRVMHHMDEVKLDFRAIEFLCVDEADRVFEMGVDEQLTSIVKALPANRQTVLCSATLPRSVLDFVKGGDGGMAALRDPVEYIRLDADVKIGESLKMQFYLTRTEQKAGALLFILNNCVKEGERTVIFAATKHHVEYLSVMLENAGFDTSPIYGQMDQTARNISLAKFQKRISKILVVTDVAARGIDIPELENVVNFDFPGKAKLYIHRVGRTARAGRSGKAYSLVAVDEVPYMLDLYLFLGKKPMNVAQQDEDPETNTECYYGTIPERLLEQECESVRGITENDVDVANLARTVTNALKLYKKTRASASKLSAVRSKPVRQAAGVHPALAKLVSQTETDQDAFVAHLRSFRPDTTVLEASEGSSGHSAMKQKRGFHDRTIREVKEIRKRKISKLHEDSELGCVEHVPGEITMADGTTADFEEDEDKSSKFRDPNFFIDYRPTGDDPRGDEGYALGGEERIDDMVLDLMGEDAATMNKQRSVMKWDAKKKKYTMQTIGKDGKVMKENAAGTKVKDKEEKKVGRSYKAWQDKTKLKISRVGEEEKGGLANATMKYRKVGGRRVLVTDGGGRGADDELKTKEQMIKAKEEEMSKKSKNSKGHKGGKGGDNPLHTMKVKGRAKFSKGNHSLKAAGVSKPKGTASAPGHGKNNKTNQKRSKVNLAKTKYTKGKQGANSKKKK